MYVWQGTGHWLCILNFAVARSWLFVNWFQCLTTALAASLSCHPLYVARSRLSTGQAARQPDSQPARQAGSTSAGNVTGNTLITLCVFGLILMAHGCPTLNNIAVNLLAFPKSTSNNCFFVCVFVFRSFLRFNYKLSCCLAKWNASDMSKLVFSFSFM